MGGGTPVGEFQGGRRSGTAEAWQRSTSENSGAQKHGPSAHTWPGEHRAAPEG